MRREGARFNVRTNQTVKKCPLCTKWHCHKHVKNTDFENFIHHYNSDRAFRKQANIMHSEMIKNNKNDNNEENDEINHDEINLVVQHENNITNRLDDEINTDDENDSENHPSNHLSYSQISLPKDFTPQKYKRHISGYVARNVGYSRISHKHKDDDYGKDFREFSRKSKYFVKSLKRLDFNLNP
ncbi:hypothetical protein C9374_001897 [Naegleria lovaniensis]|uniref:Uncharacterized protein n=1 Tax=Naegleria lovaniensis TaxID=51637 RepID=A0AA88KQX9_NAELO|nr:uncharacterized protein C9374_001897 [Naegleria lovaniensis]KAG2386862.1 hypothetical protein C9374_001897 [Naegleria lovaniensis]